MNDTILPRIATLPWRKNWYSNRHWRKRRAHQLRIEPLCRFCLERGVTTPATIADHVVSHGGDWNAFMLGELQSLCTSCHNSTKRLRDIDGTTQAIDEDGWPIDPRHQANAQHAQQTLDDDGEEDDERDASSADGGGG